MSVIEQERVFDRAVSMNSEDQLAKTRYARRVISWAAMNSYLNPKSRLMVQDIILERHRARIHGDEEEVDLATERVIDSLIPPSDSPLVMNIRGEAIDAAVAAETIGEEVFAEVRLDPVPSGQVDELIASCAGAMKFLGSIDNNKV